MSDEAERAQQASWQRNAAPWARVVRDGGIRSRQETTNDAVLDAITELAPGTVLDVGCGEGWLVRALVEVGIDGRGVDGSGELVALARERGGDRYDCLSYAEVAGRGAELGRFDLVVANFALLGDASTRALVSAVPRLLQEGGHFVLQTVHPGVAAGAGPYTSGWREGSWEGFGDDFRDPPPWYFRTTEDWVALLLGPGLELVALREPVGADARPCSLLLVARSAPGAT